ncbi:acyl-CoA dehydrogenase [Skermania sp. ID1734]|uniref:acyl-CoA dehydrogenase family protein n=1 Tax=Skermania sp. ID1734 TaxID=2597516 RepID=UPI00117EBDC0|nr:acyl-CoA dehydrogenase family protein [Skermania sp. ID1734]TSE01587.1 acyl-CoA dehydrogenase [Skermania sp. ID1734]
MKRTIYDTDHEDFRAMIRDFLAAEVVPHYEDWTRTGTPRELFNKLGDLGIMGFGIPEEYGGPGAVSYKYQAIISEETTRVGVELGHYMVTTGIVLPYFLNLATEDQRKAWLPRIASGEIVLAIAMTEPGAGSDLAGIRTTATLSADGRHYLLNGAKTFITGARNADLTIVVARTSPATDDRRAGLSLLVVENRSPGFEVGRQLEKIGQHAIDTCELAFSDVVVPVENVLGEEGRGFWYLGQNLPRERLAIANHAVASAAAAVEFARTYVQTREVFGHSLAEFQNTKFVLAECATEVEAAQALVDKALELDDDEELGVADAARAKLFCTEVAARVIDKCLQLHGGYGYITEHPIARLYADTRVNRIYGGTSEVMKTIIAKELGL